MITRRSTFKLASALALAAALPKTAFAADKLRIAMVVKSLGNGFFDACRDGGLEAAKELGDVDLLYTGPTSPTAEAQIAVVDSLIAQKVNAIVISSNDISALIPVCKKAMAKGITVVSFDSAVGPGGRVMHLNPSNNALIGAKCVQMMGKTLNYEGDVAILSATAQATNQNIWIEEMKKEWAKPEYAKMKLVATVYGDDQADKSYREAQGLFKAYPEPQGHHRTDLRRHRRRGQSGGRRRTGGQGLRDRPRPAVRDEGGGARRRDRTFAIWNPIDLGYSATMIAALIASGKATGKPGTTIHAGRMGDIKIGEDGSAAMADPFTFDKSNVEKFAKIF